MKITYWRQFSFSIILVALLLSGCAAWDRPLPLLPELTDAGVQARLRSSAESKGYLVERIGNHGDQNDSSEIPAPNASFKSEVTAFSLVDAIAYAQRHSPRLRSARAAIERSRGKEQAAFAPYLPEISFASQNGITSYNQGPGAPGPTGFIVPTFPGKHSYFQQTLQLIWTLYDFGRRSGRYHQAVALEQITELQLTRADQTVQFDAAAAYLNILLARASIFTQEDAIRQAQSTLKDSRAFLKGGVATADYVLRAEVHLAKSQDAFVRAKEAQLVATAQLNNVMGRNAALPLKVYDLKPPPLEARPSLAECLKIAAAHRPEVGFARQAVVAAQENVVAARAAFYPRIYVGAGSGHIFGLQVMNGWQEGAGLHLEFPLYAGGLLRGELRAAKGEMAAAVADAQTILDRISLEVSQAVYSEESAENRLTLSLPAIAQARENLREVRIRYRNGNAYPTDIVDAETALTQAQERYNSALYNYLFALARLDYAMGRPQGTILRQVGTGALEPLPPKLSVIGPKE